MKSSSDGEISRLIFPRGIGFFFAELFSCTPVGTYAREGAVPQVSCDYIKREDYALAGFDVAIDFLILLVPVPFVLQLQMRTKTKIAVLGMFGLGAV